MSIIINILLVIHVMVSLLIVLLVLMQRPKSEGLGAAFGGGMTDNLFGAQTTNVLQKATRWLGGMFFALTLVLSMLYSRQARASRVRVALKSKFDQRPCSRSFPWTRMPSQAIIVIPRGFDQVCGRPQENHRTESPGSSKLPHRPLRQAPPPRQPPINQKKT